MNHRSRITIGFALCLLVCLTACSPAAAPMEGEAPSASTEAITLVDALGREVTFEQPPQRIVITGRAHFMLADAAYCFPEASERVAGLSKSKQTDVTSFTELLDPNYEEKAIFDAETGAEDIAAVQPDAVLLKSYLANGLGASVEQLGIPVVYIDLETPEQYKRDFAILGQLFDDPDRAVALWGSYQARLDELAELAEAVPDAEKPRALVLQYAESGGEIAFKAPPASWIQTQMVELAGGLPVWEESVQGSGWVVVNLEQIAAWDPDHIFIISYFSNVNDAVDSLIADPLWQELTAVQTGQVHGFPKDFYSWDQPDNRWILGLTWMASQLYPERFQVDMEQEFYQFYETFYGLDAATVEAEIVTPLLEGNAW